MKMIVKGVSVDLAAFYNIPYSNLGVGTFFQQLPESIYDGRFCMVHIYINSLFVFYIVA